MSIGIIRRINDTDLEQIIEIERKCFDDKKAYTPKQLKYLITKANSYCLAELNRDVLRGFIIVLYRNGSRFAGIEIINVDPKYHGEGIGTKLLNAAEEGMKNNKINKVKLEVSIGNLPAINLYKKFGFKEELYLKNYYKFKHFGTYDAYKMIKDLAS